MKIEFDTYETHTSSYGFYFYWAWHLVFSLNLKNDKPAPNHVRLLIHNQSAEDGSLQNTYELILYKRDERFYSALPEDSYTILLTVMEIDGIARAKGPAIQLCEYYLCYGHYEERLTDPISGSGTFTVNLNYTRGY